MRLFARRRHVRLAIPWDQWDEILSSHSPGGTTHRIRNHKEAGFLTF